MKSVRNPRFVIAFILLLLAVAFLGGTVRLIHRAQAASLPPALEAGRNRVGFAGKPDESRLDLNLTPTMIPTQPAMSTPSSQSTSADTTGIIALAIVIVATILLGAGLGVRAHSSASKNAK